MYLLFCAMQRGIKCMKKRQSNRLSKQQVKGQGSVSIFHKEARKHDKDVFNTSVVTMHLLEKEFPSLKFRYRKGLSKKEINEALKRIDSYLGQTLFVEDARIIPDGGMVEVLDDNNKWRIILVSEAKHQGNDIENIQKGILVGKNKDQDIMMAGNAIERAYKNINEIANYMLAECYFPYVLFLEGSNFLTQNVVVTRPDGRKVTLIYNAGNLNRLDRLTASNYGMPINTNLCKNRHIKCNESTIMLQAVSIYTKSKGGHWNDKDMISIMLEIAKTSLKLLSKDLFNQITKK